MRSTRSGRSGRTHATRIKQLYSGDRSEIIWTPAGIERLKATSSPEIGWAVDLAAHTGVRQSDLLRLSWSHVGENEITIKTDKSGQERAAAGSDHSALRRSESPPGAHPEARDDDPD